MRRRHEDARLLCRLVQENESLVVKHLRPGLYLYVGSSYVRLGSRRPQPMRPRAARSRMRDLLAALITPPLRVRRAGRPHNGRGELIRLAKRWVPGTSVLIVSSSQRTVTRVEARAGDASAMNSMIRQLSGIYPIPSTRVDGSGTTTHMELVAGVPLSDLDHHERLRICREQVVPMFVSGAERLPSMCSEAGRYDPSEVCGLADDVIDLLALGDMTSRNTVVDMLCRSPIAASHGDAHPGNVLIDRSAIHLIDLDNIGYRPRWFDALRFIMLADPRGFRSGVHYSSIRRVLEAGTAIEDSLEVVDVPLSYADLVVALTVVSQLGPISASPDHQRPDHEAVISWLLAEPSWPRAQAALLSNEWPALRAPLQYRMQLCHR